MRSVWGKVVAKVIFKFFGMTSTGICYIFNTAIHGRMVIVVETVQEKSTSNFRIVSDLGYAMYKFLML